MPLRPVLSQISADTVTDRAELQPLERLVCLFVFGRVRYRNFVAALPPSLPKFSSEMHKVLPVLYDTKYGRTVGPLGRPTCSTCSIAV